MRRYQPLDNDATANAEDLPSRFTSSSTSQIHFQSDLISEGAGCHGKASSTHTVNPPYQPLIMSTATPVGARTLDAPVTPTQSMATSSPVSNRNSFGSAGPSGPVPYNPLGPYNPLAAPSSSTAGGSHLTKASITDAKRGGAYSKNGHTSSVRVLTYNPIQTATSSDLQSSKLPSGDGPAAETVSHHHTSHVTSTAACNAPQQQQQPAMLEPLQQQQQPAVTVALTINTIASSTPGPTPSSLLTALSPKQSPSRGTVRTPPPLAVSIPVPVPVPVPVQSQPPLTAAAQCTTCPQPPQHLPLPSLAAGAAARLSAFTSGRRAASLAAGPVVIPELWPSHRDEQQQQQLPQQQQAPAPSTGVAASQPVPMPMPQLEPLLPAGPDLLPQPQGSQSHTSHQSEQERQQQQQQQQTPGTDLEALRGCVEFLHEMLGGRADVATCRDVLEQVEGDIERASHFMLEMYGGSGGGAGGGDGSISAFPAAAADRSGADVVAAMSGGVFGEDPDHIPRGAATAFAGVGFSEGVAEDIASHDLYGGASLDERNTSKEGRQATAPSPPLPALSQLLQQGVGLWDVHGQYTAGSSAWGAAAGGGDAALGVAAGSSTAGPCKGCTPADPWFTDSGYGECAQSGAVAGATCTPARECRSDLAAQGIFSAEPLDERGAAADGFAAPRTSDTSGVVTRKDAADAGELEAAAAPAETEEKMEEKMEELRIYFPTLDEHTMRTHLVLLNGDVHQALQLLSELHEDEIYRHIELERQAESDAALARELAESAGSPPAAFVHPAADEYSLNEVAELAPQFCRLAMSGGVGVSTSAGGGTRGVGGVGSGGLRSSQERWGLKLLVHVFGGEVDEGLLAEVLENQDGDVDAARAALCRMGLNEQQQQQHQQLLLLPDTAATTAAPPPPPPPGRDGVEGAGGATAHDPWVCRDEPAAMDLTNDLDSSSPLVSHRCLQPERSPSGTALQPSGINRNAAAPSRPADLQQQQQQSQQQPSAPYRQLGSGQQFQQPQGPIRLLAGLGVDFPELGFSDEALECIRVAFNNSSLRTLLQRDGADPLQELLERQRQVAGRFGRGLTHEEKQALWSQHREMPLALKEMQEKLRKGSKAAYDSDSPGSKRLARELQQAAGALDGLIREQHRRASALIYAGINAALQQQWKTDLHALLPAEVPGRLDAVFGNLCSMGGSVDWLIITGKGLHSRRDGPKLPSIVDEWLAARGLDSVPQPGAVLVRLTPEVFARVGVGAGDRRGAVL